MHAAEGSARLIGIAGAHAVELLGHRRLAAAVEAPRSVDRAVQLEDEIRVGAGSLVEAVDVLRQDRADAARPLELDEREVAGAGLGGPCLMVEARPCIGVPARVTVAPKAWPMH